MQAPGAADTPGDILSRTHLPGDVTEVVFRRDGELRLGRIYPSAPAGASMAAMVGFMASLDVPGVRFPDLFGLLDGGRACLSLPLDREPARPRGGMAAEGLVARLAALLEAGFAPLSLDRRCLAVLDGEPSLVCWGEGLLALRDDIAPELIAGGYPGPWSTAYALGRLLAEADRMVEHGLSHAGLESLVSPVPSRRAPASTELGLPRWKAPRGSRRLPGAGPSLLCGGDWRSRDRAVNELAGLASSRGMRVRVLRCRGAEAHRPLPDTPPPRRPVLSPGDLLERTFGPASGMDRLLVVDDAQRASPDLAAIIGRLSMLPPPGLRLLVSAPAPPDFLRQVGRRTVLEGAPSTADDLPLSEDSRPKGCGPPGPSWFGPRVRCPGAAGERPQPPPAGALHDMGADRVLASMAKDLSPDDPEAIPAAASLIRLERWREALALLPGDALLLRGKAMLGLGRAGEALALLRRAHRLRASEESLCLLARALIAADLPEEAEGLLRGGTSTRSTVLLADLLDSLGRPAEALGPLRQAAAGSGRPAASLLCAQARIYMRLGRYTEALRSTDRAVSASGASGSGDAPVESLLTRGRVREVIGEWDGALDDYRMAVSLFEAASRTSERPPHVDLYVLLLRTGRPEEAETVWSRLLTVMPDPSAPDSGRMPQMLLAYRSVLLGAGEAGLPHARRATELAATERNPLHQALSTMYAGVLTVQAGRRGEGIGVIRAARAQAGLLGDGHLLLMCDLELLTAGAEGVREDLQAAADELGLVPESLRAAVLQQGDAEALEEMLELPAPLEALAAAAACRPSLPPALLARLRRLRDELAERLPKDQSAALVSLCRPLEAGAGGAGSLPLVLSEVSRWAVRRLERGAGLDELAEALGIRRLDTVPSEGCEVPVSEHPPLYASSLLPGLEEVGPLLSALASSTTEQAPEPTPSAGVGSEMVGSSKAMKELRDSLRRAAAAPVPVLLLGETGTGKELAARAIHGGSTASGPFVPVDCGAIPPDLLESELFGARRGAYTGLGEDRTGLIEEAREGTLFLDEIGNLPENLQVKLLRALDTGRFRRLGENRERESSFRLLAATNADLQSAVARGDFRDDLYYRIAVIIVELPPLRERRGDIPLLARHFLRRACRGPGPEITAGALRKLQTHSWPGNVRELGNVVQRAVALSGGADIRSRHIVVEDLRPAGGGMETLREATARHVRRIVEECGGNRTRAAEVLDCSPKTVRKYLRIAGGGSG